MSSKTVTSFQVLLKNTKIFIQRHSFVYKQINDRTVLFLTIQFSISRFSTHSLNFNKFYLTYRLDPFKFFPPG